MREVEPNKGLKLLEFFGIPGVGKTYLVRTALPTGIERPMDWFSQGGRARRIARKVSLILKHMPTALSSGFWARKMIGLYRPLSWRRRGKILFNWVFVDCLIREMARSGTPIVVLDQGISQALWSTQFGAGRDCPSEEVRALLRRYLKGLPISEWVVVRVTASPEIVRKRVAGRKGFSPVDREIGSMNEAYLAELKVGEVLNALVDSSDNSLQISAIEFVNDNEGAARRLREVMGWR